MSQVKCRILCVDDHADTAEILEVLLSQEDYEVTTCASIDEAIQFAKSGAFDLYVLDRRLPDGSGLELCRKLNEVTPGVPTIFYTGDAYELQRYQGLASGADDYVPKPDIDGLITAVHRLLSERDCATATA